MTLLRENIAPVLDRTVNWAVSGWAGLELAAPFATITPSLQINVADTDSAGPLSSAIQAAGLREVDQVRTGDVLDSRTPGYSTGRSTDGRTDCQPATSVRRPVLFGARGQDAADHLKEQLVDPLHHSRWRPKRSRMDERDPARRERVLSSALVRLLYELRDDDVFLVVPGGLPARTARARRRSHSRASRARPTLTSCSSRTSSPTPTSVVSSARWSE